MHPRSKSERLSCHPWHDQASFQRIDQRQAQSLRCEAPPLRNWLGLLQRRNSQCLLAPRCASPVHPDAQWIERDLLTVVRPSVPVPEQLRRAPSPGCTAGLGGLGQVRTAPTEGSLAAYWRTRIPDVSSKRSTLSDLGNGASSTSPTLTPYFQSGGQMAMKRA